jgi:hypothetical protein
MLPTQAAFQDLGALLAHQPGVTARAHRFVIDSPFGTIHAATFSMPRPIGTDIPHPPVYALANFDPRDVATTIGAQLLGDPNGPLQFPKVNRKDKRDSELALPREPLPQVLASHVRHDVEEEGRSLTPLGIDLARVVQGQDVGMGEPGGDPDLAGEALRTERRA